MPFDIRGAGRHLQGQAEPVGDYTRYYAAVAKSVAAMKAGDAARAAALNPVRPAEAVALMALLEAGLQSSAEGGAVAHALTDAERAALD